MLLSWIPASKEFYSFQLCKLLLVKNFKENVFLLHQKSIVLHFKFVCVQLKTFWQSKLLHNLATCTDRYNGDYFDDKPHGTGIYNTVHGDSYVGDFVHGKFEGMLDKNFVKFDIFFHFIFTKFLHFRKRPFKYWVRKSNR